MRDIHYLNLDLLIESRTEDGEYAARIIDSPSGESATVHFRLPLSELEFENFLLRINQARRRRVRGGSNAKATEVKDFGGRLFESVFTTDLRRILERSRDRAEESEKGLRVRLRLSNCPELADLPWEFLYDTANRRHLALSDWTPVIRYLDIPAPSHPMPVDGKLRILVMVSRPTDLQQVDSDLEWEHLLTALQDLVDDGRIEVARVEDGSLGSLQRALRRGEYHVFHFIGHGEYDLELDDGVLFFEDRSRHSVAVSAPEIGSLLHDHRSLRLAVLNSCEGARSSLKDPLAGTAPSLIHQGISAVVAMQFEITDDAAILFASSFYEALADGYPIDASVVAARKMLHTENPVEWGTPVLYLRSPDGELFDIVTPPRGRGGRRPPVADGAATRAAPDDELARPAEDARAGADAATAAAAYEEGLELLATEHWVEAEQAFRRLEHDHPGFRDVPALLRRAQIGSQYGYGLAAQAAEDWSWAETYFTYVVSKDPGFRDARARLDLAQRKAQERRQPDPRRPRQDLWQEFNAARAHPSTSRWTWKTVSDLEIGRVLTEIGPAEHIRRVARAPLSWNCNVIAVATDQSLSLFVDTPRERWAEFVRPIPPRFRPSEVAVRIPLAELSAMRTQGFHVYVELVSGARYILRLLNAMAAGALVRVLHPTAPQSPRP